MEHRHILTIGEIKDGRLVVSQNSLDPVSYNWFEQNSGKRFAVYSSEGSLIRRNVIVSESKLNAWRFNCGKYTFQEQQPGNAIVVKTRLDGNLEIQFSQTFSKAISVVEPSNERYILSETQVDDYLPIHNRRKRVLLGEPLNFRGLQHAPINEQGVVFLFGMVCRELGYLVESVQTGFPDCEGKRRIDNRRWERVRIEFEFKSSNFVKHGHDPTLCDLIICWEHDWLDCPMEVVELRKHIQTLNHITDL